IPMMKMSIGPLLSLKQTTIPTDRGEGGGPSHNHKRFTGFNIFRDGQLGSPIDGKPPVSGSNPNAPNLSV
ncbi:MAG: hypothetical protein WBD78_10595, partial [Methylocella sp.]